MKTPMKIAIVATLAVVVVAAGAVKNRRTPTEANIAAPTPGVGAAAEIVAKPAAPAAKTKLPRLVD